MLRRRVRKAGRLLDVPCLRHCSGKKLWFEQLLLTDGNGYDQGGHRLLRPSLFFRQAEDSSSTTPVLDHGARTRSAATTPRSSGCGFATMVADVDHQR
nr:hypothetical protein Itr_chr12CG15980 [Ipomoea trifida]